MNLSLQDPFTVAKEYPDTLVHTLQFGHAVHLQFSHRGDYLAAGLSDGTIAVYDTSSHAIVCVLRTQGHVRPITLLSWSRCGQYLLLLSQDWLCILWDLGRVNGSGPGAGAANMAVLHRVAFEAPLWLAALHPKTPFLFVALVFEDDPVLVDVSLGEPRVQKLPTEPLGGDEPPKRGTHRTLAAVFSADGEYIVAGTSLGWVNVISTQTMAVVKSHRVASANIKSLLLSPNGRKLAVNCLDRVVRQLSWPDTRNHPDPLQWDFDVEHKYQDVVNRLQWNTVMFNHNAEFLVASTFGQSSHDLYVWETHMGTLVKILEGSPEELIDVKWNYSRCTVAATGLDLGTVYLWLVQFPLKWSALAPDFVEIDENEEYEEKEDEFDIIPETDLLKKRMEEEDTEIDILTMEPTDVRGFDTQVKSFVIPINYELAVV